MQGLVIVESIMNRMVKYIEDTLYSLTNKKDKPLIYADKRYISKWGVDKIIGFEKCGFDN